MIVLDVRFYSQVPNPDGRPADWPASAQPIDDSEPATPGATRMTVAAYDAYRAARQAGYDAWKAQYRIAQAAARAAEALAQARTEAAEAVADGSDKYDLLARAIVLEVVRYVNQGAGQTNALIDWLNTQTSLTQRGQLNALKIDRSSASTVLANVQAKAGNGEAG